MVHEKAWTWAWELFPETCRCPPSLPPAGKQAVRAGEGQRPSPVLRVSTSSGGSSSMHLLSWAAGDTTVGDLRAFALEASRVTVEKLTGSLPLSVVSRAAPEQ